MQRKEEEDRQTKQLVHALEAALEQEKAKVHSLKEQVCEASHWFQIVTSEPIGMRFFSV